MMIESMSRQTLLLLLLLSSGGFLFCRCTAQLSTRLYGVNYSLRIGPDWVQESDKCKSTDAIRAELMQLKLYVTDNVRVYNMVECDTGATMIALTLEVGMKVWLGVWVGPNQSYFTEERARLLQLLNDTNLDFGNVLGIHVSSEAIYRREITVPQAIALRNIIKSDLVTAGWSSIPVTVADIIDTNLNVPKLIAVDDFVVTFNQFPFWEKTVDINGAATYMSNRVKLLEAQAGKRQIIVTETGWADAGSNQYANVANPSSMAKWMRDFVCLANGRGWQFFWFDSYDSDWRRLNDQLPDDVEGHFGE
jgi:glucan 1,3-beta-glucosidase